MNHFVSNASYAMLMKDQRVATRNHEFIRLFPARYAKGKWLLNVLLAVSLFLFSSNQMKAQEIPVAALSSSGVLQIPSSVSLSSDYYFDLSQFTFASDAEMTDFLSDKSGEHFIVRALPHLHKGILILNLEDYPSWGISDWNTYLQQATTAHPILYTTNN